MSRRAVLAVLACLLLSSCDGGGSEPTLARTPLATPESADSAVIGLVATLSGRQSWRGEDAFEGADLGVHVLNRSRTAGERTFELVTLDDRGDPQRATALVEQLAGQERTVGIVYAGPPEGLPPASDALAAAGIPAFICYGDLYSAKMLRPPLYQVSPPYLWQARRIVRYLLTDRGYRNIGAVVERTPSGVTAARSLQQALDEAGGREAVVAGYRPRTEAWGDVLSKLRRRRVEAVVVHGAPDTLPRVVRSLEEMGSLYRTTRAARRGARGKGRWRPHLATFDLGVAPDRPPPPPGTVGADTYARGAHYLPVPSFRSFRVGFDNWWSGRPLGWELRSYEAVQMIAWAARRAPRPEVMQKLEQLDRRRFGGLEVTLGPDDHTAVEASYVGLWVVPRRSLSPPKKDRFPQLFASLPWVPLARGFSISGKRTDIAARDWKHLFRDAPPRKAPAPRYSKMRFGVTTRSSDPVH